MRTILIALLMTLATQVAAADKKYDDKACNDISKVIDFLLSLTPQMWKDLENDPTVQEALEAAELVMDENCTLLQELSSR